MHLDETTFVVTDTETTGTHSDARIIEIAAVKIRAGEEIDRFDQLVDPGCAIPRTITRLTGITTGMVFDQPAAADVLPAYREFLGEGVLVAHNLSFDRRMIDGELTRMGAPELDVPTLCTLRLARRLLHELPSKSLEALIRHYGIRVRDRHRALADARAASEVLRRLIAHYSFQRDSTELEDLLSFQYANYRKARPAMRHVDRIRSEVIGEIPRRPGVYVLKDEDEEVLYVGKAKSLRSRVRSYFTGIEGHGSRIKKLVRAVRSVDWEETETELDALFRESRLIKEQKPRFNRSQLSYGPFVFLRLEGPDNASGSGSGRDEAATASPEITISPRLAEDGADYYGPITSRRDANRILGLIHQAFGLTLGRRRRSTTGRADRPAPPAVVDPTVPASEQLRRVRAFLRGEDSELLECLEDRMQEASDRLEFEEAGWYRDELERLKRLFDRQMRMRGPVRQFSGVLVERHAAASSATFLILRGGRVVERHACPAPVEGLDRAYLRHLIEDHLADPEAGGDFEDPDVDRLRILLQWMMQNEARVRFVRHDGEKVDETVARIVRASEKAGEKEDQPVSDEGSEDEGGEEVSGRVSEEIPDEISKE